MRPSPVVATPRIPNDRYDAPAPPQVVMITAPRPLYECITPDGERYPSDSDQGNPRWVPLWTMGYGPTRRGPSTRVEAGDGRGSIEVDAGVDTGPIVAQTAVPVHEDDDVDALHERIKAAERTMLVETVGRLGREGFTVTDRKVRFGQARS